MRIENRIKTDSELAAKTKAISITLTFLTVLILIVGCNIPTQPHVQYSRIGIKVNGQELYFKRRAKGLDYDLLILSPNKDHCAVQNTETDYSFEGFTPKAIYYKVEGNTLHLYSETQMTEPQKLSDQVKILHYHMSPYDWAELGEKYREKGLALLRVDFDKSLTCGQ